MSFAPVTARPLVRPVLHARWKASRAKVRGFFDGILAPEAYERRPIALRHPFVFYDGHLAAFPLNTFIKRTLGGPGIDADLERLFERGIDPETAREAQSSPWPGRPVVASFVRSADAAIEAALGDADRDKTIVRDFVAILEHESMHRETLFYMLHQLPGEMKRRPDHGRPETGAEPPRPETIRIPAGRATLGADPDEIFFAWDNEFPRTVVAVPAFSIDRHSVTNAGWLEFVDAGGYDRADLWDAADLAWKEEQALSHPVFWMKRDGAWHWRGQFETVPLPHAWPVYVSHAEASAYARWKGKRLPTEPEYHRAAFGTSRGERAFPWGDESPAAQYGNFDERSFDPVPAGSSPCGASFWEVEDLVGNGWEWTSTRFEGFPGFQPMAFYPNYSADFFDGRHWVMKGASPMTPVDLIRRSYRNWFQGHYPYPYAKFRCVGP